MSLFEQLGVVRGGRKQVEAVPEDPTRLRYVFQESDVRLARGTYLMQRITHLLFPQTVPAAYEFFLDPASGRFGMTVERVSLDAAHVAHQLRARRLPDEDHHAHVVEYYEDRYSESEEFERAGDAFEKAGVHIDPYIGNWTLAEGGTRNVDVSAPWIDKGLHLKRTFDADKLRAAIAGLAEPARTEAQTAFDELLSLETQERV